MRLRFATSNPGKLAEARYALTPLGVRVVSTRARPMEIQADTLEAVARAKAESLRGRVPMPYIVEDAGLFVDALGGFPGVYSAHAYQTVGCDGILRLLRGRPRAAEFRAVVALVEGPRPPRLFVGTVPGTITRRLRGGNGFGFDPIFVPAGQLRTFAQLTPLEKTGRSHRGAALRALAKRWPSRRTNKKD